jgi:YNFM family putative membrane transporter
MSGAFFFAGFGTFALIYDVQPLLPEFQHDFGVTPATASLALSLTTLALSVSMLAAGRVSELVSRRWLMSVSIVAAGAVSMAAAFAPSWGAFLALRALTGAALGGLPAVALAYLSDNVSPQRLAGAVGMYVAGTAFGGMSGRLIGGVLTGAAGWQNTIGIIGGLCLAAGVMFFFALPKGDNARSPESASGLGVLARRFAEQWRDPILRCLFLEGGLLMGCFVANFNYLCFRLVETPHDLSSGAVSLVFLMYFAGMVVSPQSGRLIARFGLRATLRGAFCLTFAGALISLSENFAAVLAGSLLVTCGFFLGHTTAGAWVNRRAESGRAIASAQYLTVYYIGASLLGWLGGWAWQGAKHAGLVGWDGVAAMITAAAAAAIFLAPANENQSANSPR